MNKVLDFIHVFIAWIVTVVAFICLDLPLKVLAIVFILLVGITFAILYPISKKVYAPIWLGTIFDYSAKPKMLIAKKVYELWMED